MGLPGRRGFTGLHGHHRRGKRPETETEKIICETCGAVREYRKSELRVRKKIRFCSIACRSKGQKKPGFRVKVACDWCGKECVKRRDHIASRSHLFCSKKCVAHFRSIPNAKWRDKQKIREYMANYTKANRKALNEAAKERNRKPETNRKKRLVQKRYRLSHKEYLRASSRARRAGASAGSFTESEWVELQNMYGNKCLCCCAFGVILEADHVVPLSRGGPHCAANIQPLCRSCNASKGAKSTDYRP